MTPNPIATHIPRKQGAAYRDLNVFYNEWDKPTAAWLVELGNRNCLHSGTVDTRSIRDVRPDDLRGYDQCHFFAGIGGWPYALELAGYGDLPCWTGSPPCQPFSVAGKQAGSTDERHLAPIWLDLIRECRPPVIFGEQVADAIRVGWLDDLFDALEECGYACGASVLPACSVGAPHIRKRLFFGAVRLADANGSGRGERRRGIAVREEQPAAEYDRQNLAADQNHYGWAGADWLLCRDSKFRPVEPGTQPLAHGLPARVGRLRGYGNAIVPQAAAEFVAEFMASALSIQRIENQIHTRSGNEVYA